MLFIFFNLLALCALVEIVYLPLSFNSLICLLLLSHIDILFQVMILSLLFLHIYLIPRAYV